MSNEFSTFITEEIFPHNPEKAECVAELLEQHGIHTIQQLTMMTPYDLRKIGLKLGHEAMVLKWIENWHDLERRYGTSASL